MENKKNINALMNILFFIGFFCMLLFNHFGKSEHLKHADNFYMGIYCLFFFYVFSGGYINNCPHCNKTSNKFIPDNFLSKDRFFKDLFLLLALASGLILFLIGPVSGLGYPGLELLPYGIAATIFTIFFFSCLFFNLARLIASDRKISLRVIATLIFSFGITMIFLSIRSKEVIFLWKFDKQFTVTGVFIGILALILSSLLPRDTNKEKFKKIDSNVPVIKKSSNVTQKEVAISLFIAVLKEVNKKKENEN